MPSTHTPVLPVPTTAQLQRVRWSLVAMFGLFGIVQTSWMGRLPSVRESLGISAGQLGTLLVVGAVGSLVGVTLTGTIIVRFGSRATLVLGMVGTMAGFTLVGLATALGDVALFSAGLLVNGLVVAATNIPINLEAARVEKQLGKSILPHVHASFSVGALLGSAVAATTSTLGMHVVWHIVGVAVVVTVGRALLIRPGTELADQPVRAVRPAAGDGADMRKVQRRHGAGSAMKAWTERRTLLIGLVILAASMSEGAAANWLNLGVVDGFATREAVGAAAYGTFVVAMLAVRLLGAGLIDRFGRVAVLRVSGVSALVGLLAFGLSPSLPLAWAGIVLWGLGAAMAWPLGTAAAADDPTRAAARVSVVGSFGSIASLSMPPVLGLLADSWGVRHALLVITVAMVISLAAAGQVRAEKGAADPAGAPEATLTDAAPDRTPTAVAAVDVRHASGAAPLQQQGEGLDDADVAVEPVHAEEVVGV
ncbi:MFS transporter [Xylanimonas protaetiae]|uniref:MFS transporter n=1 Tax=Xylanimonas protaetiae TaxID=2509457 RepID=A0A4P6F4E7_9MICO|nr:MFS transporter [Xylanimonas protaetiae]QAY69573.1 MFS transporter [Xylanimonas protaetiae]